MKEGKKRSTKNKDHIAKVGAELFSKKGFAETSMHDISVAAKLSKGGIYHYFSSKTDLLYYILDNFMDLVLKGLEEDVNKVDNKLEKVKKLIFRHIEMYPKHFHEAKTLFHEVQNLSPESFKKLVVKEKEYYRITGNVLSQYFGSSVDKNQVTAIAFILLGMCNSIYGWYNPKNTVSPKQLSQIIFDILTYGVSGFQKKNTGK